MAELFLGFTSGPGGFRKYVVIKRILPDVRDNEQFERMFLDEARITAAFNHPNIAQVFDLGQEDDGLYLAMEFIAGQNLNQITGACLRRKQQVPLGFTLSVARDICMALHYAHTFTAPSGEPSPVIHRDVAQKNVMVNYDGVVKLLDFGIAKAKGSLERTSAGTVKGTTGYMSTEQVRGDKLDGRSDLFSVGVMMHELITGARLFAGRDERDEMMKILEAPIPWPSHVAPHVPEEVSKVVMRALERSREKRFPTGRDMARAIEAAAGSVLMDADHRASLMRELFTERMAATRALLESAEGTANTDMVASAKRALRGEDGPYLPERKDDVTPQQGVEAVPRKAPRKARATGKTPAVADTAKTERRGAWLTNVLWGLLLLGIVVVGGYGAWRLSLVLNANVEPEPQLRALDDTGPRLPEYREPGTGVPDAGVAKAEPNGGSREDTEADGKAEAPVRARKTGKLTLLVNPDATVYRGKVKLGRTPIFAVEMPVGEHRLTIIGPDGKKRRLSVPIELGKTAQFRLTLADIPER
ncbi:serine/threonine protein kinase [Pyxidicoccus xibeiensis]|uniref:serine/threonine protein kinase n=1 Tax=Pyxidicoccus xibeiensis TaxID=2906759 RepID=UPI0020A7AA2B|nr:serine/threonine-protein kinase [Pyxidicoccus xibeiensis]MCP3137075.1 serine/threonine protein kinase [Pyxidicoccus xibeiensis]